MLRGRPPLNIPLQVIIITVRRHGQALAASRELRCSDAYLHVQLKKAGLTLREVLESETEEELLEAACSESLMRPTCSEPRIEEPHSDSRG